MDTVTGNELKVRVAELSVADDLRSDHSLYLDSPTVGSARMEAAKLVNKASANFPAADVPVNGFPPSAAPLVPISTALGGERSVSLYPYSALLKTAIPYYLGPAATPPISDQSGNPVTPGYTYYNTVQDVYYIYSSSGTWVPLNHGPPTSLTAYYYYPTIDGTLVPPNGAGTPDSSGKVLSFAIPGGQPDADLVNVFLNGALQVNGVDYALHEGSGGAGDYVTFSRTYCGGSCIVVQKFEKPVVTFNASAVGVNTGAWVFNGTTKTFPLKDFSALNVIPGSTVNCLVSINDRIANPFTEFTVSGATITFAVAPSVGTAIWMVAGVPIINTLASALQDQITGAQIQLDNLALQIAALRGELLGLASVPEGDSSG